jgi:hypothetical protein
MAASIGAEAVGLAADKAEQRRIIASIPERSSHPGSVGSSHPLKYSNDQRLWVSLRGHDSKSLRQSRYAF